MSNESRSTENQFRNIKILIGCLVVGTFLVYYFSNPKPQSIFDYTFRVADNLLHGAIGFKEKQPSWLNEFVPFENNWYSVFPLGSVLTMLPFALFKVFGLIKEMPSAFISALTASLICLFLLLIARKYDYGWNKRILLALAILFGTWMWANESMASAWQLALGFAMVGELGAIYFTVFNRRPLLAGAFFALAFGNRTEVLLTAPIFMFLLTQKNFNRGDATTNEINKPKIVKSNIEEEYAFKEKVSQNFKKNPNFPERFRDFILLFLSKWKTLALFCVVPFVLGVLTLIYNYIRFRSFTDFGYARIPGVLDEPWYNHGIFSLYYIPGQAYEMLWKPWEIKTKFPYLVPNAFSSSVLWSSPFILLALRFGARDKILKYASWAAISILTFLLWMHGNSGGWQFGYRYAMILLPWIFLILLENSPKKITLLEWSLYTFSFVLNAYSVYLFHWSEYIKP
jgi:multisubunit Na+/H+ antiporter MnhB subunit